MSNHMKQIPLTLNHVNVGLVAGTTSTYTTTAASSVSIRGKFATVLTAQTNTASPTTDAVTGSPFVPVLANNACCLLWGINTAGAIRLAQGAIVPTETGAGTTPGNFITTPPFPTLPDDVCPIGYAVVRVSPTGATFTPGTTAWAASGITTTTFRNIATMPDRPQLS